MKPDIIVGLDEVGRGSWAGPLAVGAVVLKDPISGLKDSKRLSKKQREELEPIIKISAMAWGLGWAEVDIINKRGLTYAISYAMESALGQINVKYDRIVIDGNYNFLPSIKNVTTIIDADETLPAVSAASIIAKVARDKLMIEMATKYPGYGFESNVGYGTKLHFDKLKQLGPTPLHRITWKPLINLKLFTEQS